MESALTALELTVMPALEFIEPVEVTLLSLVKLMPSAVMLPAETTPFSAEIALLAVMLPETSSDEPLTPIVPALVILPSTSTLLAPLMEMAPLAAAMLPEVTCTALPSAVIPFAAAMEPAEIVPPVMPILAPLIAPVTVMVLFAVLMSLDAAMESALTALELTVMPALEFIEPVEVTLLPLVKLIPLAVMLPADRVLLSAFSSPRAVMAPAMSADEPEAKETSLLVKSEFAEAVELPLKEMSPLVLIVPALTIELPSTVRVLPPIWSAFRVEAPVRLAFASGLRSRWSKLNTEPLSRLRTELTATLFVKSALPPCPRMVFAVKSWLLRW